MVDHIEATAAGMKIGVVDKLKIYIVDRVSVAIAVNKIKWCAAYAFDGRESQLHWPGGYVYRLSTHVQSPTVGRLSIFYTKGHAARRGTMFLSKIMGIAAGFVIDNKVDIALAK